MKDRKEREKGRAACIFCLVFDISQLGFLNMYSTESREYFHAATLTLMTLRVLYFRVSLVKFYSTGINKCLTCLWHSIWNRKQDKHTPLHDKRALPFSPTTPQNEAGILTEPPPSVPIATGQRPTKNPHIGLWSETQHVALSILPAAVSKTAHRALCSATSSLQLLNPNLP